MTPLTAEWIAKAENDLASATRESQVAASPNYDLVCFLAQQCVEKYLKALLTEDGIAFRRTHDLVTLLDLLSSTVPAPAVSRPDLDRLSSYAVDFRYPGASANSQHAADALAICAVVRQGARSHLGLAP